MKSYNEIIADFETFANNHYQIKSFGNGDLWEAIEKDSTADLLFPRMWVVDNGASLSGNDFNLSFSIYLFDQPATDESDENEIKSDMLQVAQDILAFFRDYDNSDDFDYILERTASLTSFTDSENDSLTGWRLDLTFKQNFLYYKCAIPKT